MKIFKLLSKPLINVLQKSSLYFIKNNNVSDIYISDSTGTSLIDILTDKIKSDIVQKYSPVHNPMVLALAFKDNEGEITAGENVAYIRSPRSFLLKHIRMSVFKPSVLGDITISIKINNNPIINNQYLTIDFSHTSSLTSNFNYNNSIPSEGIMINNDDIISFDVISEGKSATGMIVQFHEG